VHFLAQAVTYKFTYYTITVGFGIFWIALPTSSTRLPRRVREFHVQRFLVVIVFLFRELLRLSRRIRMITVVSVLKAPQSTEITSPLSKGLLLEFHAPLASLDSCKAIWKAV
jgi:hypothetical protein